MPPQALASSASAIRVGIAAKRGPHGETSAGPGGKRRRGASSGQRGVQHEKRLDWTEIRFLRIADGKIVEHWSNFDQAKILRQLGVLPS